MEIEKVMIPIEKIINNSEECFAHVAKDNKQKETLKEHTERCQKYWKNLVEKKNLTEILEEFEKCYFNSTDEKVKEIFESMTVNIVTMHDIGKVNPEFQKEKMDHLWHRDVPLNDKVGSKHSIISSVFYLDYYIGIINLAVKNETIYKSDGEKLKDFAYIYSYIISRHHGDLTELERYLESLNGKQAEGDELGYQAGNWYELWKKSIMKQGDPEKIRKNWKRMLNRLNGDKDDTEKIIYLYCLTRLLYSLLVAADYYATTEYMNGFEMTDFGELNQWEHIIDIYEKKEMKSVILIATQVIEAGVDIDMDIGYNEVSINTKLLDFLSQNNIIVHFFNYYGGYSGTFYPRDHYLSGKLIVKQAAKYQNDRLDIARAIVKGIGLNIYEVLYHYYKHDKKEVKETIDWIKKIFLKQVEQAANIKELLAYEGEVWLRFYSNFKFFLPEDFVMNKRVKRPPDNPINALISFGNTLLYTKTISAIYQTHLDQRISFLHEPSEGRFSLSLDISEVFKPVIVYRTIFDLVNNRRLQVEKHFEKKVNYCILNEEGRKIFIEAFEARMESVFMHPKLKRKVSYRTAIKLDCYKLIKNILEEKEFIPFSLKEGM